jgi:hypothetical protein
MRYRYLALVGLFIACKKPEVTISATEAGPAASVPPIVSAESSAAPVSSAPTKYTFAKQTDFVGRWSIDIPTTFTKKTESNPCSDSGCLEFTTEFDGDDIEIRIFDAAKDGHTSEEQVAKWAGGGKIVGKKNLPRGYWIVASTATTHVFVQDIDGWAGPVRLVVKGPETRKAEIENLISHLSSTWSVPESKPAKACKPLPWPDGGTSPSLDFGGMLVVGSGLNASSVDEKPYILQTDEAWCDSAGNPCWEFQAYTIDPKPPLKSLVGKHVLLTGTFDSPITAHHHRPIMLEVKKAAVQ